MKFVTGKVRVNLIFLLVWGKSSNVWDLSRALCGVESYAAILEWQANRGSSTDRHHFLLKTPLVEVLSHGD